MKALLWVFLASMIPMTELRGSVPLGCSLGLPAWQVYLAAVAGNLLPVPLIVLFSRRIFSFLRRHWSRLNGLLDRIEARAQRNLQRVQRFQILGLCLFVAIPLPGTGAWTGGLIAALLDIRLRRALPTILLGLLVAGLIMTGVSYGFRLGIEAIT